MIKSCLNVSINIPQYFSVVQYKLVEKHEIFKDFFGQNWIISILGVINYFTENSILVYLN